MATFPLSVATFFVAKLLKLLRFQIKLFSRFITFPLLVCNFCAMYVLRTITRSLGSVCSRINSSKNNVMKSAMSLSWGVLCSVFVLVVLAVLLFLGFAVSGIAMRSFAESPIFTTHNLYFDYTKTSPTAVVPITASRSPARSLARRPMSCGHRIRLTVTLTLPESEYNRKLGVFQVRVESLSLNGNVIVSSSYPTMLRFKSQAIRAIESSIKIIPYMTGMKSEGQNLVISVEEFEEGDEATMGFRVSLEKRADLEDGCGVPEIYGATLDIASSLPPLKGMAWNWRLTLFVWIGFALFMAEIMLVSLCCTPLLFPGRRSKLHQHFED